jgi:hypothetical protein
MMWTRLESNVAVEFTDIDPVGRFHESLMWVACPEDLTPGSVMNQDGSWTYAPKIEIPPPQPALEITESA